MTVLPTPPVDRRRLAGLLAAGASVGLLAPATLLAAPDPSTAPGPWTGEGFVERPGGRLRYLTLGEGPPLVLLHKLGGWAPEWRWLAPHLAAKFRVIAFDMPGHGLSRMNGPAPYIMTLGEHGAMIHAALRDMGIERYHLMGGSLGGCAGVVMAASYPGAVTRLALLSTALYSKFALAEVKAEDDRTRDRYDANWVPKPRTLAMVAEFANLDPLVNDELNRSRAMGGAWVRASERGVEVAGLDQFLPQIAAPTLLAYADRGRYTRFEAVGRARIAHVEVAVIKDAGSFFYQEKPVETAAAVLPFLTAKA